MAFDNPEFFKELLSIFKIESDEHINTMTTGLDQLDKKPTHEKQMEIIEKVHRAAHSLKGAARTVGLTDVEPICQSLESIFNILKRQKASTPPEMLDMLHRVVKGLGLLLSSVDDEGKVNADKSELIRHIDEINSQVVLIEK
jgi:two-component system chemotaxis sensor kinase CheA